MHSNREKIRYFLGVYQSSSPSYVMMAGIDQCIEWVSSHRKEFDSFAQRLQEVRAELRKLPIRQETVEITELFDLDPYRMDSKGAVLIGTFHGMELTEELKRAGIPATVIGRVSKGPERILYNQEIKRYIEKPARTEKKENEG